MVNLAQYRSVNPAITKLADSLLTVPGAKQQVKHDCWSIMVSSKEFAVQLDVYAKERCWLLDYSSSTGYTDYLEGDHTNCSADLGAFFGQPLLKDATELLIEHNRPEQPKGKKRVA